MEKTKIIKEIRKIIKKHLSASYKILIFGSWTKGNAISVSDIDIGILGVKKVPWSKMAKILEEVEKIKTLRSIDIVDLRSVSGRFRKNALAHSKAIK